MIPIIYRLRERIRLEDRGEFSLVISEVPLNVVRTSKRAVQVLKLCDGERTLPQVACEAGIDREETVFNICDYFNKKAVLETSVSENRGYFPSVSVIIPTRNRGESLLECLESLYAQDYGSSLIEIIVVDDGSRDETQKLMRGFSGTLLTNSESRGQSYCRNLGAREAKGEILAFLDDDCVAGRAWLRDLTAYFQWEAVGAVGGYVDGYSGRSLLDGYEKKFSPLNMGKYILRGTNDRSTFYVPTCNMLVRKQAFVETGGIRETMHLGEDVDFCWRMHDTGWQSLYVPSGIVRHKHRNTLLSMLRRRADYGTSEAVLFLLHPRKVKTLQMSPLAAASFLGCCLAVLLLSFLPLLVPGTCYVAETAFKIFRLGRKRVRIPVGKVCFSVLRAYMSFSYRISFHLVRYYFLPLILSGFALHSLWILCVCFVILAASVDYSARRPHPAFPLFLFLYVFDQIAYQIGVLAGCLRARSFRPFRLRIFR